MADSKEIFQNGQRASGTLSLHNAPDSGGEAPDNATTPNIEAETGEPPAHAPADRINKTDARPSIDKSDKTGTDTASTALPAHTVGSKPSVPTTHNASAEQSEAIVPIPQTAITEQSTDTAPTVTAFDTDPARRTVRQRKSELDEYRRRYMRIPRIADRKPVFVSRVTRDRLDRIVRLLGERGMSVSGLIENIALHHLETHEPDIEHWRKM